MLAYVCARVEKRFELNLKVFIGVLKKGGSVGGKLVREEAVMWREERMGQNVLTRPSQRKRGPAKALGLGRLPPGVPSPLGCVFVCV